MKICNTIYSQFKLQVAMATRKVKSLLHMPQVLMKFLLTTSLGAFYLPTKDFIR